MDADNLTPEDVRESLVPADDVHKTLRSRHRRRTIRDRLYVIRSRNFAGTPIYAKGTFRKAEDSEVF